MLNFDPKPVPKRRTDLPAKLYDAMLKICLWLSLLNSTHGTDGSPGCAL